MQHGGKWGQPEEIIRLDGVRSLAAGSHLSAVVSDEGQLHIWGKLLSEVRSVVYGTSAITHTRRSACIQAAERVPRASTVSS